MLQKLIFSVIISLVIEEAQSDMYVNMMSFKCSTSNKTIRSDLKCWTKSFSRKFSTVNLNLSVLGLPLRQKWE